MYGITIYQIWLVVDYTKFVMNLQDNLCAVITDIIFMS